MTTVAVVSLGDLLSSENARLTGRVQELEAKLKGCELLSTERERLHQEYKDAVGKKDLKIDDLIEKNAQLLKENKQLAARVKQLEKQLRNQNYKIERQDDKIQDQNDKIKSQKVVMKSLKGEIKSLKTSVESLVEEQKAAQAKQDVEAKLRDLVAAVAHRSKKGLKSPPSNEVLFDEDVENPARLQHKALLAGDRAWAIYLSTSLGTAAHPWSPSWQNRHPLSVTRAQAEAEINASALKEDIKKIALRFVQVLAEPSDDLPYGGFASPPP
eukprot:m.68252 g.68252  ORF g.68252 m.68252 type:complete len:270 (+) comp50012_c0_seq6:285-1094(+)